MKLRKTYTLICLSSILLFFTESILFISGTAFDTLMDVKIEKVDLLDGETDTVNETPAPLEEQHATAFEMQHLLGEEFVNLKNDAYLHSIWKSVPCTTTTPPPDDRV